MFGSPKTAWLPQDCLVLYNSNEPICLRVTVLMSAVFQVVYAAVRVVVGWQEEQDQGVEAVCAGGCLL